MAGGEIALRLTRYDLALDNRFASWYGRINMLRDGFPHEWRRRIMGNEQNPPGWPFKHLSAYSEWPLHAQVLSMAQVILAVDAPHRTQAAMKMTERCFRMGARLALEFGLSPTELLMLARMQIEREIPGAKKKLAAADAADAEAVVEAALGASAAASELVAAALADAAKTIPGDVTAPGDVPAADASAAE